ncbi:hypothetical protein LJC45_02060 [Alistipes sp. OttesenSCG-928-B03]|nr:hypothetical protein [Alistipes sp. OttesenSCG-928-B03]
MKRQAETATFKLLFFLRASEKFEQARFSLGLLSVEKAAPKLFWHFFTKKCGSVPKAAVSSYLAHLIM